MNKCSEEIINITSRSKTAIELLKAVLLLGDEKDKLQIKLIEEFLITNGEIKKLEPEIKYTTKKDFKERCSFHVYGRGKNKRNAIYFDWQNSGTYGKDSWNGYKFMVKTEVKNCKKDELFNHLYNWVTKEQQPIWYIQYRYASTDNDRFKVSLVG